MAEKERTSPGSSEESEKLKLVEIKETSLGPSEGLESEGREQEKPAELTLMEIIAAQNETLLAVNKRLEAVEESIKITDQALIETLKKVGSSGGGSSLLAQLLPLFSQRGPGIIEKIAMRSFYETMAFSTLLTRRMARKQFGEEFTRMVQEMEADISGVKTE